MTSVVNPRIRDLALKLSAHMIDNLNELDDATLRRWVDRYEGAETTLDKGVGQVLRLYQTARTIGKVANYEPRQNGKR
jgi:hypothetical protein